MTRGKKGKKKSKVGPSKWRKPLLVLIPAGALLLLAVLLFRPDATPSAEGAPRLVVSRELIDHGDVQYDIQVDSVFTVRNEGEEPLKILGRPQVVLADGC